MAQRTDNYNFSYLQFGDKWYPGIDYENMLTVENQLRFAAKFIGPCIGIGWTVDYLTNYREEQLNLISSYLTSPNSYYGKQMTSMGLNFDLTCAAGSTTNINLASPPTSIDGIDLEDDDKVLVKDQSSKVDNGVYLVQDANAGIWTRDTTPFSMNYLAYVQAGNSNTSTLWIGASSMTGSTFGVDPIYFEDAFKQCVKVFPGNGIVDIYYGKSDNPYYFRAPHDVDHYIWADAAVDMTNSNNAKLLMPEPPNINYGSSNNSTYLATVVSAFGSTLYDLPIVQNIIYGEKRKNYTDLVGEFQSKFYQNYITHKHLGEVNSPEKVNLQTFKLLKCLNTYEGQTAQSSSVFILYNDDGSLFTGNFDNYGIPVVYHDQIKLMDNEYRFELGTTPCKLYLFNSISSNSEIIVELPIVNQKKLYVIDLSGILITSAVDTNYQFLSDSTLEDRTPEDTNSELVYANFCWSDAEYTDIKVYLNDELISPKHYEIHPSSGMIRFLQSFVDNYTANFNELSLIINKIGIEVKSKVQLSHLENIDATTFSKGVLNTNQISNLSHNFYMRYKEKAKYNFDKLLISGAGNSAFYPEKTKSQLQYNSNIYDLYESVNFGEKKILYGTSRGLLRSKDDFKSVEIIKGWNNDIGRPAQIIDNLLRPENENIFHATYMTTLEGQMFYTKDEGATWVKRKLPYDDENNTKFVACFDVSSDKYLIDENTYKESLFIYMGTDTGAYYAQVFKNMSETEWEWQPIEFYDTQTIESITNINDIIELSTKRIEIEVDQQQIITYDRSVYVASSDPDYPGLYAGNQYLVTRIFDEPIKGLWWAGSETIEHDNNIFWWDDYNIWMTHIAREVVEEDGTQYTIHPFSFDAGSYTDCVCGTVEHITLSGLQTIDDYTVSNGDRVLVKNQNNRTQNGIYVASSGTWSRASDLDNNSEFIWGKTVKVTNGSFNAGNIWFLRYSDTYVIGTTQIIWRYYKVLFYSTTTPSYTAIRPKINGIKYRQSNLGNENFIISTTDGPVLMYHVRGEHLNIPLTWEAPLQGNIFNLLSVKDETAEGVIYAATTQGLYKSTPYIWQSKDNLTDISLINNSWQRVETVISPNSDLKVYDILTGDLVTNYTFYPQWQIFKFDSDYDIGSNLYYETLFTDFYINPWYNDLLDDNNNLREHRVVVYIDDKPTKIPYYTDSKTGLIKFVSGVNYTDIDKITVTISSNDLFVANVGTNTHNEIFMGAKKGDVIARLSQSNQPSSSVLYLNQDIDLSEKILLLEDGSEQEIVYIKSINNFVSPPQIELQYTREKTGSSKIFPIGTSLYSIKDGLSENIEDKLYQISSKEKYNLGSLNNLNHLNLTLKLDNEVSGLYDVSPAAPFSQDDNRGLKNLININDFANNNIYDSLRSSLYAPEGVPSDQVDDDFEVFNIYDIENLSTDSINSIIITDRGFWSFNGNNWDNFYLTETATCNFIKQDEGNTYKVGCDDGLYTIDENLNVVKDHLFTQQIKDYSDGYFDGIFYDAYAKSDGVVITLNPEDTDFTSEYVSCVDGVKCNGLFKTSGTRIENQSLVDFDMMFIAANNGFHAICKASNSDIFSSNFVCKTVIDTNPDGVERYYKSFTPYQYPSIPENNKQSNILFILTNDGILKVDNYRWVDPCSSSSPLLNITDRFLRGLECLSCLTNTLPSPDGIRHGESRIYIGTNKGVYRSLDGGITFEYTNRFNNKFPIVYSLKQFTSSFLSGAVTVEKNVIVACTDIGIWYTIDEGDNWYQTGSQTEDNELPISCGGLPDNHIPWSNDLTTGGYIAQSFLVPISGATVDKVACHIHSSSFYFDDERFATSLENNVIYATICSMSGNYPDHTNILETSSTTYTLNQINNKDELTFFDFNYAAPGGYTLALVLHEVVTPGGIALMEWQKVNQIDETYQGTAYTFYDNIWNSLDSGAYQYNFKVYFDNTLSITETIIPAGCDESNNSGWEDGALSGVIVNDNGELVLDLRFLISLVIDDTLSMTRISDQNNYIDKTKSLLTELFDRTQRTVNSETVNFSAIDLWSIRDTVQRFTKDGFITNLDTIYEYIDTFRKKGTNSNLMDGLDIASNSLFHNSINNLFTDTEDITINSEKISNVVDYCNNSTFTRNPYLIVSYNDLDEVDNWDQNATGIPNSHLASRLLVNRFSNTYKPILLVVSDGENTSNLPLSKIIENSEIYWGEQGFDILFFELSNLDFQAQFHRITIYGNGYHFQTETDADWDNVINQLLHGGSKSLFKGSWTRTFKYNNPTHIDRVYTSYTNPGFGSDCKVEFRYSLNNETYSDWIELTSGSPYSLQKKLVYLEYRVTMEEGWDGTNRYSPSIQRLYHAEVQPASVYLFSDLIETDGYINEYIITSNAVGQDELDLEFGICRGDSTKWKNFDILTPNRNSILPQRQKDYKSTTAKTYSNLVLSPIDSFYYKFNILNNNQSFSWNKNYTITVSVNGAEISNLQYRVDNNTGIIVFDSSLPNYQDVNIEIIELPTVYLSYGEKTYTYNNKQYFAINGPWVNDDDVVIFVNNEIVRTNYVLDRLNGSVIFSDNLNDSDIVTIYIQFPNKFRIGIRVEDYEAVIAHQYDFSLQYTTAKNLDKVAELKSVSKPYLKDNRVILSSRLKNINNDLSTNHRIKIEYDYASDFNSAEDQTVTSWWINKTGQFVKINPSNGFPNYDNRLVQRRKDLYNTGGFFENGDQIYVKVQPRDKYKYGSEYTSEIYTLNNYTKPEVNGVNIKSTNVILNATTPASSELSALYTYTDVDFNTNQSIVTWYDWTLEAPEIYTGAILPSTYVTSGKIISYIVRPFNGVNYGNPIESNVLYII